MEIVRSLYRAMAGRDLEGVKEMTDPDLEWISDPRWGAAQLEAERRLIDQPPPVPRAVPVHQRPALG